MRAMFLVPAIVLFSSAVLADEGILAGAWINVCNEGAVFVCPTSLRADSRAALSLPSTHPSGFAIRSPGGTWSYLAGLGEADEVIPGFSRLSRFEFVPKDLLGATWDNGSRSLRRVFDQPGRYLFYFASNLETEPENTDAIYFVVEYEE